MSKETTDMMTVSELKSILAKYDNEQVVAVNGGEDEYGSFAYLVICDNKDDAMWCCGDIIMEYEK